MYKKLLSTRQKGLKLGQELTELSKRKYRCRMLYGEKSNCVVKVFEILYAHENVTKSNVNEFLR